MKASPAAACASGTGRDGLANHSVHCCEKIICKHQIIQLNSIGHLEEKRIFYH